MCVRCTTPAAGITRSALCQCCSQRVLEGEKAMRSEAAHRLREVEAQLAARRGAGGGRLTPPDGSPSEEKLAARQGKLRQVLEHHSKQIQDLQGQLLKCREEEERRGGA